MASVQVDLTEYDMLRDAKNKAEQKVLELEQENKSLRDNTSCVIKTRYYKPSIDCGKVARFIHDQLIPGMNRNCYTYRNIDYQEVVNIIKNSLENSQWLNYPSSTDYTEDHSTTEVVGFESMRTLIEASIAKNYEDSYKSKLADLEYSIANYDRRAKNAEDKHKSIIEDKDKTIKKLNSKISELSGLVESERSSRGDVETELEQVRTELELLKDKLSKIESRSLLGRVFNVNF